MTLLQNQVAGDAVQGSKQLTGCQDIRVAGDLHRTLIQLGSQPSAIIDCTQVDSFDASALQLLLAAKRETGDNLTIIAPEKSEAESWISLSGLKSRLQPTKLSR